MPTSYVKFLFVFVQLYWELQLFVNKHEAKWGLLSTRHLFYLINLLCINFVE